MNTKKIMAPFAGLAAIALLVIALQPPANVNAAVNEQYKNSEITWH